jgi:urease accessory protein
MEKAEWVLLQLADSATPVGAFVASAGLESSFQIGRTNASNLPEFLKESATNLAASCVPFIESVLETLESHTSKPRQIDSVIEDLVTLDSQYELTIRANQVNHRASTTQGIAYLSLVIKSFPEFQSKLGNHLNIVMGFKTRILDNQTPGHLPICFAIVCWYLGIECDRTCLMFLFCCVRTIISAAVRLNILGPYSGQTLMLECHDMVKLVWEEYDDRKKRLNVYDLGILSEYGPAAVQTAPILDIIQSCHDKLYTRIFNS